MLEDLQIYKKYLDLMYYTYELTIKYPKCEKLGIVTDMKRYLHLGLKDIISYQRDFDNINKLNYLISFDSNIKIFTTLVRISYKMKYINNSNYKAFSRKITIISNMLGGIIKNYEK